MNKREFKYHWFTAGDINGFFGLMFDNLTVLSFLAGILIFVLNILPILFLVKCFQALHSEFYSATLFIHGWHSDWQKKTTIQM